MFNDYQAAVDYIHSLPHLHKENSLKYVKRVIAQIPGSFKTVHVTGTNGKGTVCNYLTSLLVNSGLKVGTFSSPYVKKFNERIQLDDQPVSDKTIIDLTNSTRALVEKIQQTDPEFFLVEFEFLVIMMYQYFIQQKVDIGVIEVGIGGEHDKTNFIDPELSIITNVGMDHMKLIGPTLKDIAQEKSGIIKTNRPVVLGEIVPDAKKILLAKAKSTDSQVIEFGKNYQVANLKVEDVDCSKFDWVNNQFKFKNIQIKSFSKYQVQDAAIAIAAFVELADLENLKVSEKVVRQSLKIDGLPARTQIIAKDPLIILDGAHNVPAITDLITSLTKIRQGRRVVVLYAAMKDKQRTKILKKLNNFANLVIVTTTDEKRAADSSDYQLDNSKDEFVGVWQLAFAQAMNSLDSDSMLIITGSLHFAGAILNLLS